MTIETIDQAKQFLTTFYMLNPGVHPEDDFNNIVNSANNKAFNDNQVKFLNNRMSEVYAILDDPCQYIIETVIPKFNIKY